MRKEKPCPLIVDRDDCELVLTFDLIVQELIPNDLHRKVEDDERNVENGDDFDLLVQAVEGSVLLVRLILNKLQALFLSYLVGMLIGTRSFRVSD